MAGGISDEAIRERAYRIWQGEGCPDGRHDDHWLQAKLELEAERRAVVDAGTTAAKARKPSRRRRATLPAAKPRTSKSRSDVV